MKRKIFTLVIGICVIVALLSGCDIAEKNNTTEFMTRKTVASTGAFVAIDENGNVLNTPWIEWAGMPGDAGVKLDWSDIVEIDCGGEETGKYNVAGLKKDGSVVTYGLGHDNGKDYDVSDWHNIKSISLHETTLLGLKKDGTVIAVPEEVNECVSDWEDITDISAGYLYCAGVRKDGRVIYATCFPDSDSMLINDESWTDIVSVDFIAGGLIGLKSDGTVVLFYGDNEIPSGMEKVQNWTDITALSANHLIIAGLKNDGTVVAVARRSKSNGLDGFDVSDWSDIIEVSVTPRGLIGLKKDGTIVYEGIIREETEEEISQWTNLKVTN